MNTGTLHPTRSAAIEAGTEVEERPVADPTDKPLHAITEDPRYIGKSV